VAVQSGTDYLGITGGQMQITSAAPGASFSPAKNTLGASGAYITA
jgi:hypothetical protein